MTDDRTDAMFGDGCKVHRLVDLHGNRLTVRLRRLRALWLMMLLNELNRITKALYVDKFYITLRVVEYNRRMQGA